MTNERFKNQTAIITGGADGLGLHIAARLADEGARVWIADRNQEKGTPAAEQIGGEFEPLDVADEASVTTAFQNIFAKAGRLDVMVNSAGIVGPNGLKIDEVPVSGFDDLFIKVARNEIEALHPLGHDSSFVRFRRKRTSLPCRAYASHQRGQA